MKKHDAKMKARLLAGLSFRHMTGWIFGFVATVFFALYNGALGLCHSSAWHGSICVYYLLMSLLRGLLLTAEHRRTQNRTTQHGAVCLSSVILLFLNITLVVPLGLMVLDQRSVQMSLIPAITTATYTTYKIAAASVKLKRTEGSVFLRELSLLQFVDALVSILVLQNTLIIVIEGKISDKMFYLAAISSAAIFLVILALSVRWLLRAPKEA